MVRMDEMVMIFVGSVGATRWAQELNLQHQGGHKKISHLWDYYLVICSVFLVGKLVRCPTQGQDQPRCLEGLAHAGHGFF